MTINAVTTLCARHLDALILALEVRNVAGIYNTQGGVGPATAAADRLVMTHATNFAGAAAKRMLLEHHCPLCFVNKNPAGVNLDAWVENAAEEIAAGHTSSDATTVVVGH